METETDEVFEISDFTVVTESECLIVALESQINEWKLQGRRPSALRLIDKGLRQKYAEVKYKDVNYELVLYHFEHHGGEEDLEQKEDNEEDQFGYLPTGTKEMIEPEFDFKGEESVITQYGLLEHMIVRSKYNESLISNINLLLELQSAVLVATANTDCEVPVLIQYGKEERSLYLGACQNKSIRTRFEGFNLESFFARHSFFSGILNMFKDKVDCPLPNFPTVSTSICFDYVYKYMSFEDTTSTISDVDPFQMFFGAENNIINELKLSTIWPKLNDQTINETETFSDLDPLLAPRWILGVKFNHECKQLYNSLNELLDVREASTGDIKVSDFVEYKNEDSKPMGNALSALTQDHTQNEVTFVGNTTSRAMRTRDYAKGKLKDVIENEFKASESTEPTEFHKKFLEDLSQCKSAPDETLVSRISVVLLKCLLSNRDQIDRFAAVWFEFVLYLRSCWENAKVIKGIDENARPELQYCIFYQKVQMIQFCIQTKRKRHALMDEGNGVQAVGLNSSISDIFYDAEDEPSLSEDNLTVPGTSTTPSGRSHQLDGEFLLDRKDTPIYVPITQDHGPMTEDMIEERARYLESLDTDKRVRAQLDNVISDMQAFKAANPGARIEDFVRWHSPRDWVLDEDGNGRLSERMSLENNIWEECWKAARPIPVSAQIRLFNEAKEAETILHLFESLTIRALIDLIAPVIFHQSALTLLHNCDGNGIKLVGEKMNTFLHLLQNATVTGSPEDYFDTHNKVMEIEMPLARLQTLKEMFSKELLEVSTMRAQSVDEEMMNTILLELCRDFRSRVLDAPNGPISLCVRNILYRSIEEQEAEHPRTSNDSFFSGKQLKLPPPHRKQYILRTICSRPGVESRLVPQRMYVCVGRGHLRVCGSYTDDLTFR
ncbi:unnamed protein product [Bursaphelenchus xylophilus]|uniref:Rab3 GTPase-activating protein catalytic subunit n=1 Tax=Bursaphelenchus xylophilus TaxID=6326 RepID=A0A1I7S404_BURXY|nr:unnamed protein product [Bursaphelenchus xylophilus]CAG9116602.1 unnamed protein product [Bursaphelenchus xylophilus]